MGNNISKTVSVKYDGETKNNLTRRHSKTNDGRSLYKRRTSVNAVKNEQKFDIYN